jgi:hypothetical protein
VYGCVVKVCVCECVCMCVCVCVCVCVRACLECVSDLEIVTLAVFSPEVKVKGRNVTPGTCVHYDHSVRAVCEIGICKQTHILDFLTLFFCGVGARG